MFIDRLTFVSIPAVNEEKTRRHVFTFIILISLQTQMVYQLYISPHFSFSSQERLKCLKNGKHVPCFRNAS